jgi:hypothetical protein
MAAFFSGIAEQDIQRPLPASINDGTGLFASQSRWQAHHLTIVDLDQNLDRGFG